MDPPHNGLTDGNTRSSAEDVELLVESHGVDHASLRLEIQSGAVLLRHDDGLAVVGYELESATLPAPFTPALPFLGTVLEPLQD